MVEPPSGTVTFLFTDIEGSTRRWENLPESMRLGLARHDALLRSAIENHGGHVFKTVGDAFCAAFATAPEGVAAALSAQRALHAEDWGDLGELRVRMALQTGAAEYRDDDYFGQPLNRVARLLSVGHGGQILLAGTTAELVLESLPEGAGLRDLGEHRLRDLARPAHVFQVVVSDLADEFPDLRSLDRRPNNLPLQATPLVGRDRQVAEASELLLRPEVRLLTLTGPGGTGKTRLSLQVAADLADQFEDGAFFVSLSSTSDPEQVAIVVVQTLGIQEIADRSPHGLLKDYLRDRQLLLVLDNFEQVLGASGLVAELLAESPRLKVLVTSRSVLHIYGEFDFPVPPLALPDPRQLPPLEQLRQFEAVRLFIERARAVRPDFSVNNENAPAVAEICHLLDGLPLAIELAAARVRLLSPTAMLARLASREGLSRLQMLTGGARDLPARQQTLRGAIAWGYDLLGPEEQLLFRRLSVFGGGCTMESAEAIVGDGVDVFDGLASLVDKSLLGQQETDDGEPRFAMLATIREFASEQLALSGEGATFSQLHAEYFLELADQADPKLRGPDQRPWLIRLTAERDNFRAAGRWFHERGQAANELWLCARMYWLWTMRGHLSEGRAKLAGALERAAPLGHIPQRAWALFGAGGLAWAQSDYASARALLEESAAMFEELGDQRGLGYALNLVSAAQFFQGDVAGAAATIDRGTAILERVGDSWGQAVARFFRANTALGTGDYEAARANAEASLRLYEQVGDRWARAKPRGVLGRVALHNGDLAGARAHLDEARRLLEDSCDNFGRAFLLNNLGDLARNLGDYEHARVHYEEAVAIFRDLGNRGGRASVLHNLGYVAQHLGDPAKSAALFRASLVLFRDLGDDKGVAECLAGLAGLAVDEGRSERAAELFGAAEALLERSGTVISDSNEVHYERSRARAEAEVDPPAFAAALAAGREQSVEELLAVESQGVTV